MLELTLEKANDMNDIVAKTLEKNQTHSDGFEISWYSARVKPDLDKDYLFHLHSLMNYYNQKYSRNWVTIGDRGFIRSNYNTGYFYKSGGFKAIFEQERRQEAINILTEKQLKKSIWQIRGTWMFIAINAVVSFIVAYLTKIL